MPPSGQKTVRFTQVVERSGEPHVHTLWLAPEKDAELKRAQKEHRVMMLARSTLGGKTDIGSVGFDVETARNGQVLIFPKSLKRFEGARVVGIKFDLVEQPKFASAAALRTAASAPAYRVDRKRKPPPPEAPPAREPDVKEAESEAEHDGGAGRDVIPFAAATEERQPAAHEEAASVEREKPVHRPPRGGKRVAEKERAASKLNKPSSTEAELVREIRAAMKELERGKSVAAYQRLQRALSARDSAK